MRILFDQGTPKPLRTYLPSHSIVTASEARWSLLTNGELLAEAEAAGFDLLITTDRNIAYQQNLSGRKIAILVLGNGQWPRIEKSVALVVEAVSKVRPSSYGEIAIP